MFIFIRLIISIVFFLCSVAVIKRLKKANKRKLYIVLTAISIMLYILLSFFTFENLFLTFDSPESAYGYFIPGKADIELVVEGKNCDLIVDYKGDSDTLLILPKTEHGWKIGTGSDIITVTQKLSDGISVNVYKDKNSNDHFITVLDTNEEKSKISDSYNTEFHSIENLSKNHITYYAYLADFNTEYYLEINGKFVTFN